MISKPKTVPLLYLYLLLSHAVVTSIQMTASSDGPHASKESLQNLRQVAHVTASSLSNESPENLRQVSNVTVPPPSHNFLENLQTHHPVVASPPMNVIPENQAQNSHGIEERSPSTHGILDAVNALATSLKVDQFPRNGILKIVPKHFQKHRVQSLKDSKLISFITKFEGEILYDVAPNPHNYNRLIEWIEGIKKEFRWRPRTAYSTIAVILSEELGTLKTCEVIAALKQHHSAETHLIKTALFQHWRNKDMDLVKLLEKERWTSSEDVIKTLRNPGFDVINEFTSILEKEGKELRLDSFVKKLHDSRLEDQVPKIIELGESAYKDYHRVAESYVTVENHLLRGWISKLRNEYSNSLIDELLRWVSVPPNSVDTITRTYNKLKSLIDAGYYKSAEEVVHDLSKSEEELKLFVVLHTMKSETNDHNVINGLLEQLRAKWQTSAGTSNLEIDFFKLLHLDDVGSIRPKINGIPSSPDLWKAFQDVLAGTKVSTESVLLSIPDKYKSNLANYEYIFKSGEFITKEGTP